MSFKWCDDKMQESSSQDSESELNAPPVLTIATTRFYQSPNERTWEAWFNKEIANDIYADFQIDLDPVKNMNDSQRQELAIRLASLGVSILKRKNAGSRNLQINANALRRELERINQKPYDTDIISVAVDAINTNIDYYDDLLSEVVGARQWNQHAIDVDD